MSTQIRGDYDVPFDAKTGSLLRDEHSYRYKNKDAEWRSNDEFTTELQLICRHSNYVLWEDVNHPHRTFPMCVNDLVEMIKETTLVNGRICGVWRVRKQGTSYGLKFIRSI